MQFKGPKKLSSLLTKLMLSSAIASSGYAVTANAINIEQNKVREGIQAAAGDGWTLQSLKGGLDGSDLPLSSKVAKDAFGGLHVVSNRFASSSNGVYQPAEFYYHYFDGTQWTEQTILTVTEDMVGLTYPVRTYYDITIDSNNKPVVLLVHDDNDSLDTKRMYIARLSNDAWQLDEIVFPFSTVYAQNNYALELDSNDKAYVMCSAEYVLIETDAGWQLEYPTFGTGDLVEDNAGTMRVVSQKDFNLLWANKDVNSSGPNWDREVILDESYPIGYWPKIVFDANNYPHISHTSNESGASHVLHTYFDGVSWVTDVVAEAFAASYSDISIADDGTIAIGYTNRTDYPRTSSSNYYVAENQGAGWSSALVWSSGNYNPLSLIHVGNEPVLSFSAVPYYYSTDVDYGSGWSNLQFGDALGEDYPFEAVWNGIVVASLEETQISPDDRDYFIATTAYGASSLYLRIDENGVFKSRTPGMFDFSLNMHATALTDIDNTVSSALGDFNNDGLTDFVSAGYSSLLGKTVIELQSKSYSNNLFDSNIVAPAAVIDQLSLSAQWIGDMAAADFNNDGNLDFVLGVSNSYTLSLYLGNGDGSFAAPIIANTTSVLPWGVDAEDVNGDGNADLVVVGNYYTWKTDILLGDGLGGFTTTTFEADHVEAGHQTSQGVTASDFDGDGKVDLVVTNFADSLSNAEGLAFYKGLGDGTFNSTAITSGPEMGVGVPGFPNGRSIDNAYLNSDNIMDLIVADEVGGQIYLYAGNGDGSFSIIPQEFMVYNGAGCDLGVVLVLCLLDPLASFESDVIDLSSANAMGSAVLPNIAAKPYSALIAPYVARAPVAAAGLDLSVHMGDMSVVDGTASFDPDGEYPLSFSWSLVSVPAGSNAVLLDSMESNASITPDLEGDYQLDLVVTDANGNVSATDSVLVSTFNTPPVADAGDDQSIIVINTLVSLDGTQSWDDDGDTISYQWSIASKPAGSVATLSDATSGTPSFSADVNGEYRFSLTVSDSWVSSVADITVVSFENVAPVADAGMNQSVMVGDVVYLDASASSDVNSDQLSYLWAIVSAPVNSAATLVDASSVNSSVTVDLAGEYIVSLTVNDGIAESDASNITLIAISQQDATLSKLNQLLGAVNAIPRSDFKNRKMRNTLGKRVNSVIDKVDRGLYVEAFNQLNNGIQRKTDGCDTGGAADKNDWIRNCSDQALVQGLIIESLTLLGVLL